MTMVLLWSIVRDLEVRGFRVRGVTFDLGNRRTKKDLGLHHGVYKVETSLLQIDGSILSQTHRMLSRGSRTTVSPGSRSDAVGFLSGSDWATQAGAVQTTNVARFIFL